MILFVEPPWSQCQYTSRTPCPAPHIAGTPCPPSHITRTPCVAPLSNLSPCSCMYPYLSSGVPGLCSAETETCLGRSRTRTIPQPGSRTRTIPQSANLAETFSRYIYSVIYSVVHLTNSASFLFTFQT